MNNKFIYFLLGPLLYLFSKNTAVAQGLCTNKGDYSWVLGEIDYDSIVDNHGGCKINFNMETFSSYHFMKDVDLPYQNASYSDTAGNLIFYSNGCSIFLPSGEELINGDSLNPGRPYDDHCPIHGYIGFQNMFVLPDSYNKSRVNLFHCDLSFNPNTNSPIVLQAKNLYCTIVEIPEDGGKPYVVDKNRIILSDTGMLGSPITAVRHGNGIDWWIITPNRWENSFNRILFNASGAQILEKQFIGEAPHHFGSGGQGKFSPNGMWYAWYHPKNGLFVYSFDRTTGTLSNFRKLEVLNANFNSGGCEFSPSSQFLYFNHDTSLFQVNVTTENLETSLYHVADFDYFGDPLPTIFFYLERAPDGKIYMSVKNQSQYLHVINRPDLAGNNCNFIHHGIKLPTYNFLTIPHFPNYRLGALEEFPCDSIVSTNPTEPDYHIRIYPNPARDYFFIEYFNATNDTRYLVFDCSGKLIISTSEQTIDSQNLMKGMYIVKIFNDRKLIAVNKVVITH